MKKILIVGAFGFEKNQLDGQTVKTRNILNLVKSNCDDKVDYFCTSIAKKKPYKFFSLVYKLLCSDKVILVPCRNNITYTFILIYVIGILRHYDIIHICIGSYHKNYFIGGGGLHAHPLQLYLSKKIHAFLPETLSVDNTLKNELNFKNTEIFPNFRHIQAIPDVSINNDEKLRLVFMARIQKMKGYDIIFEFSKYAELQNLDISIDFYGQIDENDKIDFTNKVNDSKCIKYKGYLKPSEITDVLNTYDVLLLPTRYYMEGFPGTILDAYISGIPVIVTEWINSHEFVKHGETGYIVDFNNPQAEFNSYITRIYNNRDLLLTFKKNARNECFKYSEQEAWKVLKKYL